MSRLPRALPYLILLLCCATASADLRGPLAAVAELWLAGHDAEANRVLERSAGRLGRDGLETGSFRLPHPDPVLEPAALEHALLRHARDDAARLLFRAAHHHAAGRAAQARAAAREVARLRPGPRSAALLKLVEPR